MQSSLKILLAGVSLFAAGSFASAVFAATFSSVNTGTWTNPTTWMQRATLGSPGTGDGQFNFPNDVTVDPSGNIYVADYYNNRIEKFNSEGVFITAWGSAGAGDGKFHYPAGIVASSSGDIYVSESGDNNRIQEFSSDGTFIRKWGSACDGGEGCFSGANSIALDADGNVYIVDYNNNRIDEFDGNGNFIKMWGWGVQDGSGALQTCTSGCRAGIGGDGVGQLQEPTGIAVAGGYVYVTEVGQDRVDKFDTDGNYVTTWGGNGFGDGQFSYIAKVGVDAGNNVYVISADSNGNTRVQKFTSAGAFVSKWGSVGGLPGQLNFPVGVALDPSGNVYVADGDNNRIQKFDSSGNLVLFHNCTLSSDCTAGLDYPGSSDNAAVLSGATVTVPAAGSFSLSSLTIRSGATLSQGAGSTLTLSGGWGNQGTYTPAVGTSVVLSGTGQAIIGTNTFVNLTKSVLSSATLYFSAGNLTTVTGTLSLSGAAGNLLTLAPTPSAPTFSSIIGASDLHDPVGVAVDSDGYVYVSSNSDHAIKKFAPNGSLSATIGTGDLNGPYQISLDQDKNIYVTDPQNDKVYKYAPNGSLTTSWSAGGVGAGGSFSGGCNYGLVVDGNQVYVSDYCAGAVDVYDLSGNFITSFSTGVITTPGLLAADASHNIYIPSCNSAGLGVFSESGTLLRQFGQGGGADGPFGCAWDVAVDNAGFAYVTDNGETNGKVNVFSPTGIFVNSFGSVGSGDGQFSNPFFDAPMAFDTSGNFYIGDSGNNRVQKFTPTAASDWNLTVSGTPNLSYLSPSHSNSSASISCTTGCTDGGNNTNWVFTVPAPPPAPAPSGGNGAPVGLIGTSGPFNWKGTPIIPTLPSTPPPASGTTPATPSTPATGGTASPSSAPAPVLTHNYQIWDHNEDIRALQKFLNTHGFIIATTGPGSPGNETSIFGSKTYQTLKKFQKANGLPSTGYLGPMTRAALAK